MTCIVGLVDGDGAIHMGGDSAGVGGYELTVVKAPKVFRNCAYLIGFTSSFRMGQLLEHAFPAPTFDGYSLERFMVTIFVDALRDCFKQGGYAQKHNESEAGGTFLVGCYGRLFKIDSDYQVTEALCGYDAVGAGSQLALGALHATRDLHLPPARRIERALEAAQAHNIGVREPFYVEELRN